MVTQTINTIPAADANFISDMQAFLREETAERMQLMPLIGYSFVRSGAIGPTDASLAHEISAAVAFVNGYYVAQDATDHTYTASKDTFVYLRDDNTRVVDLGVSFSITYDDYLVFAEAANSTAQPITPAGCLVLFEAVTDGASITTINDLRQVVTSPDPTELDQGATAVGSGRTLYDITQDITAATHATILIPDDLTFDTSLSFASFPYVNFVFKQRTYLFRTTGDETVTFYSPDNLIISKVQQITSADMIDFSAGDFVYPQWWGATGDGSTNDRSALSYADNSLLNGGDIILLKGTYRVSSSLSFSADARVVPLNGAEISADAGAVVTFNGGYAGDITQIVGSGSFARVENSTSISQHNEALGRIRTLRHAGANVKQTVNGFVDAYQDQNGIDAAECSNESYSAVRTAYTPTRSQANTVDSEDFDVLTAWSDISSGTGSADIVAYTGDADPAIGSNGVELTSGVTLGGIGAISQDLGTVPDGQFGMMYICTLETVGSNPLDALEVKLESDGNKMLHVRHYDSAMEVYADGGWQSIFAHGGNFSTEWWVNAFDVGGGDHKIDVYAGAENVGTYTGALPAGTATDGLMTFTQNSGANNNRVSQIWISQVGVTQVADNLALVSVAKEAVLEPKRGRIGILLEDVSNVVSVNSNFTASISLDDGSNWEIVGLTNQGAMELGEIDPAKNIYYFTGTKVFTNSGDQTMRYKINVTANQFIAIHGVDFQWE